MQQEAATVTSKSKEEQAEVEEELARMAKLVFAFQVYNNMPSCSLNTSAKNTTPTRHGAVLLLKQSHMR